MKKQTNMCVGATIFAGNYGVTGGQMYMKNVKKNQPPGYFYIKIVKYALK